MGYTSQLAAEETCILIPGTVVRCVVYWSLTALLLGCVLSSTASSEELVLFGAGSLREVMTQIAADYQARHGAMVHTEFGPSGLMRERIERGERVDLFASADMGHPLKLREQGRATTVAMFTRNMLCAMAMPHVGLTPLATIPGPCSGWPTGSDRGVLLSWTPRPSRSWVAPSPTRQPVARIPRSRRCVMALSMSPSAIVPAHGSV